MKTPHGLAMRGEFEKTEQLLTCIIASVYATRDRSTGISNFKNLGFILKSTLSSARWMGVPPSKEPSYHIV
jgi:hypothetical protein